jgi:hypothetical protein
MAYAHWIETTVTINGNSFSLSVSNIPPTSLKDNFEDCKRHIRVTIEECDKMLVPLSKIRDARVSSLKTFVRELDSIISERESKRIRLFRKKIRN